MNPTKRTLRAFALLIGAYAVVAFLTVVPVDGVFLLQNISSIVCFFFAAHLVLYFRERMVDRRLRNYLVFVGWLIVFWCVLRAAKYIAFLESESIARFIWYLYYIPMLLIPQASFQAALAVGEPEHKKLPSIQIITGVISVLCILLVLTNDLHQMVFAFNPGFENWDADYSHELLYWIITVINYLFFFSSVAVLFHKCRLSASRKLIWIPMVYVLFFVLGLVLVITGHMPRAWGNAIGEFPEIACFMLGGFWVLCIAIGLIPSNKGYEKLLEQTSLAVRIADRDHAVVYQSDSAAPLSREQLASAGPVFLDENTLVHRREVTGGFAYWQVDITELNELNRELEDAQELLQEEAEIIRKENELKERRAQIDAKSRAYDEIAVRVLPQSQKIARLSEEVRRDKGKFARNMRLVAVYAVYIKRISNMMLLSSEGRIEKAELMLALSESVRYLNKAGILAEIDGDAEKQTVLGDAAVEMYEHFEALLEQALPTLNALHITLTGNILKMTFDGAVLSLPENWSGSAETDDGATFVRLVLRKEGDAA